MRRLLFLISLFLCVVAQAAGQPDLPGRFVRIYSLAEMEDGGFYAIGARDDGILYFMRQTAYTQVAGKLATARAGEVEEAYTLTRDDLPWRMDRSGTGWTLRGGEEYLAPTGSNNFQLGSTQAAWRLDDLGDGTFTLTAADDSTARVGVRDRSGTHYFGRYRSTDERTLLLLYKYDDGRAELPGDNASVGLGTIRGGRFWAVSLGTDTLADATSSYLASDTLAPDGHFTQLTVRHTGGGTFRLFTDGGTCLTAAGGRLGAAADTSATATRWYVEDGRLMATQDDGQALVLCAEETDGRRAAKLCSAEAFESGGYATMLFRPVGPSPAVDTGDDGVATLRGAWSARQIASLPTGGLTAVDMVGISLPRALDTLPAENPNMLVYVRGEESQYVPDSWQQVVAVSDGGNVALRTIVLTDRQPFHTPRPFTAEQGISYERSLYADGGWETLCLPFDVLLLPEGFVFETCQSVDGSTLQCTATRSLSANVPVLFLYEREQDEAGNAAMTLTAGSVTVNTTATTTASPLRANYADLTVGDLTEPCYLLEETGTAFVRADASSGLPPFRAYLSDGDGGEAVRLIHTQPTAIRALETGRTATGSYGLDGRRIPGSSRKPGRIIIRDGKKIMQ